AQAEVEVEGFEPLMDEVATASDCGTYNFVHLSAMAE
ncbi:hypothetical protein A2U01_0010912, partial [Trifolium medium]|nr:hypothetical protein [Trifolium medium]